MELLGGELVILIYFCFFRELGLGAFSYSFVVFAGRVVSSTLLLFYGANTAWIGREGRPRQLHTVYLATLFCSTTP